jgi:hydroxypyruvate isomerase
VPFKQGFAWWSFGADAASAPSLLRAAADIGYRGVDFLPPELWQSARRAGLDVLIIDGHVPLDVGFNDVSKHLDLSAQVRKAIGVAAAEAVPFVAVASGDRIAGSPDGLTACVDGLAPLAAEAHTAGVVLLIEPLNSKVDHPGHECDRTEWAAALVDRVGSPGLRMLYDFYHAQIMEGDLLRTVETHLPRIAHFHTAGVPGRHELDDVQEINWRAIARMLDARGYTGYVTHEFIPRGAPIDALRHAFEIFSTADSRVRV